MLENNRDIRTAVNDRIEILSVFIFFCFLILALGQVYSILQLRDIGKKVSQKKHEQLENLGIVKVNYYTSLKSMTDDTPTETAWGETVCEGMIAVSPDLLNKDVQRGDCVFLVIDGKKTAFVVADIMHPKNKRTVDIFMRVGRYKIKKDVPKNTVQYYENSDDLFVSEHYFKQLEKHLVYLTLDKVYILKSDWQKLNTHFFSRMFVKL